MIETFYNETFENVRRSTGAYDAADTVNTVSSFQGVVRPVSDTSRLFVESNAGKEYTLVCDDANDVKVGDTVVGNDTYEVLGVSKFVDLVSDEDSHLDIRLVRKD